MLTRAAITDEIEIKLVVGSRVNRVVYTDEEQRITVWSRTHDRLGGDIAGSTRPVLDNE